MSADSVANIPVVNSQKDLYNYLVILTKCMGFDAAFRALPLPDDVAKAYETGHDPFGDGGILEDCDLDGPAGQYSPVQTFARSVRSMMDQGGCEDLWTLNPH